MKPIGTVLNIKPGAKVFYPLGEIHGQIRDVKYEYHTGLHIEKTIVYIDWEDDSHSQHFLEEFFEELNLKGNLFILINDNP